MTKTIGSLLLDRLHHLGLNHIFGIPGDYILTLYKLIEESPIQHIGTTREDGAGFAADAYARIRGIGGICVPNLWVDSISSMPSPVLMLNDPQSWCCPGPLA